MLRSSRRAVLGLLGVGAVALASGALAAAPTGRATAIPPKPGKVTLYQPAVRFPSIPTRGDDGATWFASDHGIGRIDTTGQVRQWSTSWTTSPTAITAGPEKSMWFSSGGGLGRITAGGGLRHYPKIVNSATSLTASNSTTMWFTTYDGGLGMVTAHGKTVTARARRPKGVDQAHGIVKGQGGAMWFINHKSIGRVDAKWHTTFFRPGGQPTSIAYSGGWVWFTIGHIVARLSPSTGKMYGIRTDFGHPHSLVRGAGGSVWFISGSGQIDQATKSLKVHTTTVTTRDRGAALGGLPSRLALANGKVWFTWLSQRDDTGGLAVVRSKGRVQWFRAGLDGPTDIASAGGYLWVSDLVDATLDRITTSDREKVFDLGTIDNGCTAEGGCVSGTVLDGLVVAPDHSLWGYSDGDDVLFHITTSGSITRRTVKAMDRHFEDVTGIAVASDGTVWMTRSPETVGVAGGALLHVSPGKVSVHVGPKIVWPSSIAAGPDGTLWYTDAGEPPSGGGARTGTGIGRISSSGQFTTYTGTTGGEVGRPDEITRGPGGMWFTTRVASKSGIARISSTGAVTDFLGGTTAGTYALANGPGGMWFAILRSSAHAQWTRIGRITSNGTAALYTKKIEDINDLVEGPDHDMWFTGAFEDGLGRVTT
jgi:virginiamycin B lyase